MSDPFDTKLVQYYGQFPEVLETFREFYGDDAAIEEVIDDEELSDYVSERAFATGDEGYVGFVHKLLLDSEQIAQIMREFFEHKTRLTASITARTPPSSIPQSDRPTLDVHRTLSEAEALRLHSAETRDISATSFMPVGEIPTAARPTTAQGDPTRILPIELDSAARLRGPQAEQSPDSDEGVASVQTVILPANGGQRGHSAAPVAERLSELPPVEQRLSEIPPPPGEPKVIIGGHSLITHKSKLSEGTAPKAVATPLGVHSRSSSIPSGTGPSREQAKISTPPPAPPSPPVINERDIQSRAAQLVRTFLAAKKHPAHYDVWRAFRSMYFDIVNQLESFLGVVSRIQRGPFLPENRRAILDLAHASDILAARVLEAAVEKVTNPPASAEHALIFAQRNMINGTRNLIGQLYQSVAKFDDERAANDITGFLDNWRQQRNPLRWAFGFMASAGKHAIVSRRKTGLTFSIPQGTPMLAHKKPHVLLALMDRVFFRALKKKVSLNFELATVTNELAIANKKQLKKLRRDKTIRALVKELDGRWDLPGRTRRFFRWLFRRARKGYPPYHRLLIPITAANGNGLSGSKNNGAANPPASGNMRITPAEARKLGKAVTIAAPVPPTSTNSACVQAVSAMSVFLPATQVNVAPLFPLGPLPALQVI